MDFEKYILLDHFRSLKTEKDLNAFFNSGRYQTVKDDKIFWRQAFFLSFSIELKDDFTCSDYKSYYMEEYIAKEKKKMKEFWETLVSIFIILAGIFLFLSSFDSKKIKTNIPLVIKGKKSRPLAIKDVKGEKSRPLAIKDRRDK